MAVEQHASYEYEPPVIDYRKLATALDYYCSLGYEYIEAPWVVSPESTAVTLPLGRVATSITYGDLVGSGEQSFIELLRRGKSMSKACCITPCFRQEESYDELHHAYFMKLELIDTAATRQNLQKMIGTAERFLSRYIDVAVIQTAADSYDIVASESGIELGSYGFRSYDGKPFIYGTGVALPRLDTARKHATD